MANEPKVSAAQVAMECLELVRRHGDMAEGQIKNYIRELERQAACSQPVAPGLDGECFICHKPTSSLHGNPSLWPMWLEYVGGNGQRRCYHHGCVIETLAAPPAVSAPGLSNLPPNQMTAHSGTVNFVPVGPNLDELASVTSATEKPTVSTMPTGAVPTPRCPSDADYLQLGQSLTNLYICNHELPPMLQDRGAADFLKRELAKFFQPDAQPSPEGGSKP